MIATYFEVVVKLLPVQNTFLLTINNNSVHLHVCCFTKSGKQCSSQGWCLQHHPHGEVYILLIQQSNQIGIREWRICTSQVSVMVSGLKKSLFASLKDQFVMDVTCFCELNYLTAAKQDTVLRVHYNFCIPHEMKLKVFFWPQPRQKKREKPIWWMLLWRTCRLYIIMNRRSFSLEGCRRHCVFGEWDDFLSTFKET